eukprot:1147780-Pelagomonas_calceolata.AAC.3
MPSGAQGFGGVLSLNACSPSVHSHRTFPVNGRTSPGPGDAGSQASQIRGTAARLALKLIPKGTRTVSTSKSMGTPSMTEAFCNPTTAIAKVTLDPGHTSRTCKTFDYMDESCKRMQAHSCRSPGCKENS